MRRIAMEEAFWLDELTTDGSPTTQVPWVRAESARSWAQRLTDFTEYRLPEMDNHGINVQVLSLTSPGLQMQPDPAIAVTDARLANDLLAERIAARPDRFTGLAALPTQDPPAATTELRRAVQQLGLRGALINDHTAGHYLDERHYEPLWTELETLNVPLYLHPGAIPADRWKVLDGYPALTGPSYGWSAATGAHFLRLVYGRVFDRHPGVRVILGHMGEFLPFHLSRLDARHADLADPTEHLPSHYLRTNLLITTSGVCSTTAAQAAIAAVGIDNVMFAVDYPYESTADAVTFLDQIPLGETDRAKIAHGNAERVLRLPSR